MWYEPAVQGRPLALVLLVAAVGCAGCSGGEEPSAAPGPLTSAELGWVRAESAWAIAIYDEELGPDPGPALVRACEERLETVGEPPTDRLRPASEHAVAACPQLAARGSFRRAFDILGETDDLLDPLLLSSQAIQLVSGTTTESRADEELSTYASGPVGSPVEVRCWGANDWVRVIGERNAWNDISDASNEILGWGDDFNYRIHMQLRQCNALARLRREDALAWTRDDRVEAADSLATLAHEIQHFVLPDGEEDEVECAAAHMLARSANKLGASPEERKALVALYRTDVFPDLDSEYVQEGCDP